MTTPPPLTPPFSPPPVAVTTIQRSPRHPPLPYLFASLSAMVGLIALALLLLACSYWKLSGQTNTSEEQVGSGGDVEAGDEKSGGAAVYQPPPDFKEKIVVIMAGNAKPTFLATPMLTNKRDSDKNVGRNDQSEEKEMNQKPKLQITEHTDPRTTEDREIQQITQLGQELN